MHRLRSENDRLKERYQQEKEENDYLHKRLEILSQQENEVFALKVCNNCNCNRQQL